MKNVPSRACIVIAGMHRSGTSALSRVIGLLGGTHPQNLMLAQPSNLTGHWESAPLSEFHDEILASAGSSWDDWATVLPDWDLSLAAAEFRQRAIALYHGEFGEAILTVFKDPRLCRLLPFWLPIFKQLNITPYTIIPIRNPKEVAASIAKRNKIDPAYNKLLWLRYILEAEAGSRGTKRAFITYDDLLENYAHIVSTTEKRLGLKWPNHSVKTQDEIEAYLSDKHRNEKVVTKRNSALATSTDWVDQTYDIMLRWAELGEDEQDYARLDSLVVDLNVSSQRFGQVVYRGKIAKAELVETYAALDSHLVNMAHLTENLDGKLQDITGDPTQDSLDIGDARQDTQHSPSGASTLHDKLLAKADALSQRFNRLVQELDGSRIQLDTAKVGTAQTQAQLLQAQRDHHEVSHLLAAERVLHETALAQRQIEVDTAEANAQLALSLLETERVQGREKVQLLQADIAAATQKEVDYVAKLHELHAATNAQLDALKGAISQAEHESNILNEKLAYAEQALVDLERSNLDGVSQINRLSSSLAQKKAEADDYLVEIGQFNVERATLLKDIDRLKTDIAVSQLRGSGLALQIEDIVKSLESRTAFALVPKRFKRAQNRDLVNAAGIVDKEWYLETYSDVAALNIDPTLHYVTYGAAEGRSPNAEHYKAKN